jgi:S-adenosylmethionine synthetase
MPLSQPILIERSGRTPVADQSLELVERKGQGHPDSLCDAIAEEVSMALCREYLARFGRILHHNADKAMLVAGRSEPRTGGGRIIEPMRYIQGDRATSRFGDQQLDVGAIAESAARKKFLASLRYLTIDHGLTFQNELKEGSPELTGIFAPDQKQITANDTSAAVGYAPLTETERLVLHAERWLNSPACRTRFPEAGEDVKVMAVRRGRSLALTVAVAFVDRFVPNITTYYERKESLRLALHDELAPALRSLDDLTIELNTLDDPTRGENGIYLTVIGTSAEGGDCGQVGRGNRVNGLIPLNRPISNEAAAGKNPISHVGKIYSLLTHRIADRIATNVDGVEEAYVWLCSQIGRPINDPLLAASQIVPKADANIQDINPAITTIIEDELASLPQFTQQILTGNFQVW